MSDIRLFRIGEERAEELEGKSVTIERSLQNLIEKHMQVLLGVRLLASEYSTGNRHRGRIDSLGIDENGVPVIVEYKRSLNENVINQGLFYLDWLLDHRAEFQLLVMKKLGAEVAEDISWENTRLLCIAGDFKRHDLHAVEQINRNIELIRYRRYGNDLLLLELVNSVSGGDAEAPLQRSVEGSHLPVPKKEQRALDLLAKGPQELQELYDQLVADVSALGDDVLIKPLKVYIAFRRLKNFMCVEPKPSRGWLVLYLKVDPDSVKLEEGFTRDVRHIGHWGTGDLEVIIKNRADLDKAMGLIVQSYEAS